MSDTIGKQEAVNLIKRFMESGLNDEAWFQNVKEHLFAVVLYGSVAKGTSRPDSDVDVLLILPLEIEEKYTEGEYTFPFEGREINIVLRSIEKLRKIAQENNDEFQKEVFIDAEIIWSKDEEVSGLIGALTD